MVFPHRRALRVRLLPFRYKDGLVRKSLLALIGSGEDKGTAGLNPADPASIAREAPVHA